MVDVDQQLIAKSCDATSSNLIGDNIDQHTVRTVVIHVTVRTHTVSLARYS
jgi:hypothetical protein